MFRNLSRYDGFTVLFLAAMIGAGYALEQNLWPSNAMTRIGNGSNAPYEYLHLLKGSHYIGIAFQWIAEVGIGLILLAMMFPRRVGKGWREDEWSGHKQRITAKEYGYVEYRTASEETEFLRWWQQHRGARAGATVMPIFWLAIAAVWIISDANSTGHDWLVYVNFFMLFAYGAATICLLGWPFGVIGYAWSLHKRSAIPRYIEPPETKPFGEAVAATAAPASHDEHLR